MRAAPRANMCEPGQAAAQPARRARRGPIVKAIAALPRSAPPVSAPPVSAPVCAVFGVVVGVVVGAARAPGTVQIQRRVRLAQSSNRSPKCARIFASSPVMNRFTITLGNSHSSGRPRMLPQNTIQPRRMIQSLR